VTPAIHFFADIDTGDSFIADIDTGDTFIAEIDNGDTPKLPSLSWSLTSLHKFSKK
jgi:hypothetical protein